MEKKEDEREALAEIPGYNGGNYSYRVAKTGSRQLVENKKID